MRSTSAARLSWTRRSFLAAGIGAVVLLPRSNAVADQGQLSQASLISRIKSLLLLANDPNLDIEARITAYKDCIVLEAELEKDPPFPLPQLRQFRGELLLGLGLAYGMRHRGRTRE